MKLIEVITTKENLNRAYKKVVENKGASGIDGVTVEELGNYIKLNNDKVKDGAGLLNPLQYYLRSVGI